MTFASQLAAAFTPIAGVYDSPSVTRALSWAQSFVASYCNREFDLVSNETVFIDPRSYNRALLPAVPVVDVTLVQGFLPSSGGMAWTTLTNYAFVADTGLIYDTTGEPGTAWAVGCSWPWLPGSLKVTYSHGFSTVPMPLVDVACRLAQQYLENPTLQMQRRVGDEEGRFAGSKGVVLNGLDQTILDRYSLIEIG